MVKTKDDLSKLAKRDDGSNQNEYGLKYSPGTVYGTAASGRYSHAIFSNVQEYRNVLKDELLKVGDKSKREELLKNIESHKEYEIAKDYHNMAMKLFRSGKAKSIKEANMFVSLEFGQKLQKDLEKETCKTCFANNYLNSYSEENDNIYYFNYAISGLGFDDALIYTKNLIQIIDNKENTGCEKKDPYGVDKRKGFLINSFISVCIHTPEDFKKFISIFPINYIKNFNIPEHEEAVLVNKFFLIAQQNHRPKNEVQSLFDGYYSDGYISDLDFGDNGLLHDFSIEEKQNILNNEINRYLKWKSYTTILLRLEAALDEKIILPDWENVLKRTLNLIELGLSNHESFAKEAKTRAINLGLKILKLTGKKQDYNFAGNGLEFVNFSFTDKKIICLNGDIVPGIPSDAIFGSKPTNGKILSRKIVEYIDKDTVTGTQTRCSIYVWKKGYEYPKCVFSDNKWDIEGGISTSCPEVTEDGKIKFTVDYKDRTGEANEGRYIYKNREEYKVIDIDK